MSKDIIVLTPNARRITVHCTPDTNILQILEDVCNKQGLQAGDYDLKHYNRILDLTTTIRFSNLPNKACLEMVEVQNKRKETSITIGLQLEDGERRTGDFLPNTSLFDVISSLATEKIVHIQHPTVLYMRQEICGLEALKGKTLRQLGLFSGRAILRLLNKSPDELKTQANVSSVFKPRTEVSMSDKQQASCSKTKASTSSDNRDHAPETRNELFIDPIKLLKQEKIHQKTLVNEDKIHEVEDVIPDKECTKNEPLIPMEVDSANSFRECKSDFSIDTAQLERRLNIEDEVIFLGAQKAIAFAQPESPQQELTDLPDDFYELTIDEVRRLYRDLQRRSSELQNAPLLTTNLREDLKQQNCENNIYKNAVVRIQFPDQIILQGVFQPTNTIEDITNFIKEHLRTPDKPFFIFATPIKENLNPKMSLKEANFVPCVHLHFKWIDENLKEPCLKENVYLNQTSSEAASILASKYRAPSRIKVNDTTTKTESAAVSTSKSSKMPKWFKT